MIGGYADAVVKINGNLHIIEFKGSINTFIERKLPKKLVDFPYQLVQLFLYSMISGFLPCVLIYQFFGHPEYLYFSLDDVLEYKE